MIGNKCLVCGSSKMRADRALSGRLVCDSCGTPLGVGRKGKNKIIADQQNKERKEQLISKILFYSSNSSFIILANILVFKVEGPLLILIFMILEIEHY